ncbi:MAG: hypothetical protein KAT65_02525 [Methanophagales archaeon]|nr:hypothetical protein [Methanophagales archaeon]
MSKKWYSSKTLWVNGIAIVTLIVQTQYGFVVSGGEQLAVLAVINLILRAVTKQPLSLNGE